MKATSDFALFQVIFGRSNIITVFFGGKQSSHYRLNLKERISNNPFNYKPPTTGCKFVLVYVEERTKKYTKYADST